MRLLFLFLFTLLSTAGPAVAAFDPFKKKPDFLAVEQAFELTSERLASGQTRLHWRIADGYYLYQQRFKFEGLPADQQPDLPEGETHQDEFFGVQDIYRYSLEILLPASAAGLVTISWQGCADAGLCYPPHSKTLDLGDSNATPAQLQAEDQALASSMQKGSLGWSLLVFFGLGLLLAFTPCSLPMLPILAGVVVGAKASPRRSMLLASIYVVSMALVYAALGVLAALLGANLQAMLQQPWLIGTFTAMFVLLALPMFGLYELQLPAFLRDRLNAAGRQSRGGSVSGAAILGLLSGMLIGPCMTAPLAGALLFIAQGGNALQGALVLFTLGLGMGLPLLLLVTVGNRLMPRPGPWMDRVKAGFGFVLLGAAIVLVRPLMDESLWIAAWGVLALFAAWSAWLMVQQAQGSAAFFGPLTLILGLWGSLLLIGAAGGANALWQPLKVYSGGSENVSLHDRDPFVTITDANTLQRELEAAKARGQWVLIDYYADWCVSCKRMEQNVFAKPEVSNALQALHLLRLDVTADTPASRELLQRFKVLGPPTLLWLGPDGRERRERRISGEVDAATFLKTWQTIRERG